jgi:murein DD-endopeptidase MepM/ murein hydrolase activator NlpD
VRGKWLVAVVVAVAAGAVAGMIGLFGVATAGRGAPAVVDSPATALNVRTGPATKNERIGRLSNGSSLTPVCQVSGQRVRGTQRRTTMWDRLSTGGYVSDAFVRRTGQLAACAPAPAQAGAPVYAAAARAAGRWTHPLPGFHVNGGFRTPERPDHIGVDLMSYTDTPVRAAAAGRVVQVVCNIQPGGSCDVPGSPAARGCGWYVKIAHAGQVTTLYCHLVRKPALAAGQRVRPCQVIAAVGSSGRSSFPHLHFEVHVGPPPTGPQNAVDPVPFMQQAGAPLG